MPPDVKYQQGATATKIEAIRAKSLDSLWEITREYLAITQLFSLTDSMQKDVFLEQLEAERSAIFQTATFYATMLSMLKNAAADLDKVQTNYAAPRID